MNSIKTVTLGLILLLTVPFSSNAATPETSSKITTKTETQAPSQLQMSAKLLLIDYKYTEPNVMSIDSALSGFELGSIYRNEPDTFFGGTLSYVSGKGDYDGYLASENTGEKTPWQENVKDSIYTAHIFAGQDFANDVLAGTSLNFNLGLAYRYLNNMGTSIYSYEREQIYWYAPIAIGFKAPFSNSLDIRGGMEYDLFISGKNRSHLGHSGSDALEFKQNSGMGMKYTLGLARRNSAAGMTCELFYQKWAIARSSTADSGRTNDSGENLIYVEPENETSAFGFALGYLY